MELNSHDVVRILRLLEALGHGGSDDFKEEVECVGSWSGGDQWLKARQTVGIIGGTAAQDSVLQGFHNATLAWQGSSASRAFSPYPQVALRALVL